MAKRISEEEVIVNFFTKHGNTPKGETVFNIVKGIMRSNTPTTSRAKATKPATTRAKSTNSANAAAVPQATEAAPSSNDLPM